MLLEPIYGNSIPRWRRPAEMNRDAGQVATRETLAFATSISWDEGTAVQEYRTPSVVNGGRKGKRTSEEGFPFVRDDDGVWYIPSYKSKE